VFSGAGVDASQVISRAAEDHARARISVQAQVLERRCSTTIDMRVLIVDDSRMARMMLRKALPPSLSADVIEAASGDEALRCLDASPVDLMLLDLTMPHRDGYQVLKALQETGRTPPTIVVSADVQTLAAERVKNLGAIAFLKKSLKPAELTDALQRAGLL
jgi:two-component system chemotaxis response regulator CheY